MDLIVYDTNFNIVAICDDYESLIWNDRYNEPGDFELYFPMESRLLDIYKPDYYLVSADSEYTMIIEDLKVTTDLEGGDHFIVTGRDLVSILCRRIVWKMTTVSGNFVNAIDKILKQNVYDPIPKNSKAKRKIEEFYWDKDSTDAAIKQLTIDETQFTGDVVYDVIKDLCDQFDVGFSLKRNPITGKFVFSLYQGVDRSYRQNKNKYVVFSPEFDNLISTDYTENKSKYCNVTLVAGEGEGPDRVTLEVGDTTSSGLNRRELFTDARDLSSVIPKDDEDEEEEEQDPENPEGGGEEEEEHMKPEEYKKLLKNRGLEKLKEVEIEKTFDGQVDATQIYRYGRDFFMGDVCELVNQYGKETRVKVVEYIHSESTSGIEEYPTFKVVEEEEEQE